MLWLSASIPVNAVSSGGIPAVRAGSTRAKEGMPERSTHLILRPVSVMTAPLEVSEPVPEVVGISMIGGMG